MQADADRLGARLAQLARVTAVLAAARDVPTVTDVVVTHAATALGASVASLSLLTSGDTLTLVGIRGAQSAVQHRWASYPLAAALPGSEAVRTRRPLVFAGRQEIEERYPALVGQVPEQLSTVCLPLALEQAAGYLAETGGLDLAGYLALFRTRSRDLLGRGQVAGRADTINTCWSLSLDRLAATVPAAVDLLTLAAFLAPDDLAHQPSTALSETLNIAATSSRSRPSTSAASARIRNASCADGDKCRASPARSLTSAAFRGSTLLCRLNAGEYDSVPDELNRWVRAGGVVQPELLTRRREEGALFRDGVYP